MSLVVGVYRTCSTRISTRIFYSIKNTYRRERVILRSSVKSSAGSATHARFAAAALRQTLNLVLVEDRVLGTAQHENLDLHVALGGALVEQIAVLRMSSEAGRANQSYLLVG